jgi:hypothetical protein
MHQSFHGTTSLDANYLLSAAVTVTQQPHRRKHKTEEPSRRPINQLYLTALYIQCNIPSRFENTTANLRNVKKTMTYSQLPSTPAHGAAMHDYHIAARLGVHSCEHWRNQPMSTLQERPMDGGADNINYCRFHYSEFIIMR